MFVLQSVRIAVLIAVCLVFDKCTGYPSIRQRPGIPPYCQGCGDSCHKCEYGIALSAACGGIPQCAKGPDELCGGPRELYGTCGEGMHCSCNRCVGCSTEKFGCSKIQNACLPHKSSEPRDVNRFGRLPAVI